MNNKFINWDRAMSLECIALFIVYCFQAWAIEIWLLSALALGLSINNGLIRVYWETIEDYPAEDCIEPQICKKLFCYEHKNPVKGLPKEIYYSGVTKYIGFWIYSLIGFLVLLFNEKAAIIIGIVYLVVIHVLEEY